MPSASRSLRFARDPQVHEIKPPTIDIRYFYVSPLALDDPLSPIPPPTSSTTTNHRHAPRPFSVFDNEALEKTWLDIRQRITKKSAEDKSEKLRSRSGTASSIAGTIRGQSSASAFRRPRTAERKRSFGAHPSPSASPVVKPRSIPSSDGFGSRKGNGSVSGDASIASSYRANADIPEGSLPAIESASITGNPFIRAPARSELKKEAPASRSGSVRPTARPIDSYNWGEDTFQTVDIPRDKSVAKEPSTPKAVESPKANVPVGVSRLHNVSIPDLQMEPIYWLPVGDVAPVVRGTWFYYDNLLPVESDVANLLESGYVSLQAWTDTWKDELNSAVDVGASGEMKILHKLWPEKPEVSFGRPPTIREFGSVKNETILENQQEDPEKEQNDIAASAGDVIDISTAAAEDHKAAGTPLWGRDGTVRQYKSAGIIYANAKEAYILRPNLQPSSYYGRRPVANYIRKNRDIGIKVVRGFDQQRWDLLHPPKKGIKAKKAREGVSSSQGGISPEMRQHLDPSLAQSERLEVTDLVLVIHGIGQKLSERVENYHFTHAINTFRRDANVELGDDQVKMNLRHDLGGIMVLPVNWRLTLSFEDGGYRDENDASILNSYSLKDITPSTLPSVRNIVSDVMLDIPYYLTTGYHDKMVDAVVREANRIYHLWCVNNPGFAERGKVHVIAHSLGSVMAIDILSSQPTRVNLAKSVPKMSLTDLPSTHFAFNVHNLFLAGSPTGFFLLLKNTGLLPRQGHHKPGSDDDIAPSDDISLGVTGEVGTYGCLPVDNVYNVVNPYDPVAYCLNAAVDADYAAALKHALVPSASKPWISFPFMSWSSNTSMSASTLQKPNTTRLPSNVELETHNFTREEIAERKAFLLNDNGQIDFFLRYGGGALEIQYLTMLGAHSSYWVNKDFVRMLVMEIGRKPGRTGTLHAMRAVKKKKL